MTPAGGRRLLVRLRDFGGVRSGIDCVDVHPIAVSSPRSHRTRLIWSASDTLILVRRWQRRSWLRFPAAKHARAPSPVVCLGGDSNHHLRFLTKDGLIQTNPAELAGAAPAEAWSAQAAGEGSKGIRL
jgi:hypothetical protein